MFLAKVVSQAKNETFSNNFLLWELDKEVAHCRGCSAQFTLTIRRHHCRCCGGIYCADCTFQNIELHGNKLDRCCTGCRYGETPGDNVRLFIEHSLSDVELRGSRQVSVVNVTLNYGSPYTDSGSTGSSGKESPPPSSSPKKAVPMKGYFEFMNKLGIFCCVKAFYGTDGSELATSWEVPRPSYTAVPPNGIVHGFFDPEASFLDVVVLTNNSHSSPEEAQSEMCGYDPRKTTKISPCAAVAHFRSFMVFRVLSSDHNVLLKYKGEGLLEPRLGSSIARVGLFGKLKDIAGLKSSQSPVSGGEDRNDDCSSSINFATNVTASKIQLISSSKL